MATSADGDLGDPARGEHRRQPGAQVALQHDRLAVDRAAAAERVLEGATPGLELGRAQAELVDDRDLFSAPASSKQMRVLK